MAARTGGIVDFCIVAAALGAVIASFLFTWQGAGGGGMVTLRSKGGEWVFPLDAVETMTVAGPLGDTIIEINGDVARITASPCLNQTCIAAGAIHAPGQWAACLPNQVMVYVSQAKPEKNSKENVDASAW